MSEPGEGKELIEAAKTEIAEMGKEGFSHPSSKPVLIGAALGAIVGGFLPVVTWPIGMLLGAALALYLRIKER